MTDVALLALGRMWQALRCWLEGRAWRFDVSPVSLLLGLPAVAVKGALIVTRAYSSGHG